MSSQKGETALIVAAVRGHTSIVQILVHAGADVKIANNVRSCLLRCQVIKSQMYICVGYISSV